MGTLYIADFTNYTESVTEALDGIQAAGILKKQKLILVKPNLVEPLPFPITTHPDSIAAIIDYIQNCSDAKIIIAEGCGAATMDTDEVFSVLGYDNVAKEKNVELMDLNKEPLVKLRNENLKLFPEYYIPEIAMESFILSVPVLKTHSLSKVTLSLKNMMGFAPPEHYQQGGHWKKSSFHANMHDCIIEINQYRKADMILLDAVIGLSEYHLGGAHCSPPVNKLIAGTDSVEVDKKCAELLGFDWRNIKHISEAK